MISFILSYKRTLTGQLTLSVYQQRPRNDPRSILVNVHHAKKCRIVTKSSPSSHSSAPGDPMVTSGVIFKVLPGRHYTEGRSSAARSFHLVQVQVSDYIYV